MFTLGYNTNGLAHHRLEDALALLADLGYGAVALTPDVGQLDPFRAKPEEVARIRAQAQDLGLVIVIETGARFLLDPTRKHFPTLLEVDAGDRARRLDFLARCMNLAVSLGAPLVSIWSGRAPDGATAVEDRAENGRHWDRLCEGLAQALAAAREVGVELALEPEPGMFIERPSQFLDLRRRLGAEGEGLGLTLDVGHLVVTGDLPVGPVIRDLAPMLRNVHLDDCPAGVHRHGSFGSGDLDLDGALSALVEVGYSGVASVELSRDSHRGSQAAEEALGEIRRVLSLRS
jgi:L-ribulose-5-phosphate 3-epimerase